MTSSGLKVVLVIARRRLAPLWKFPRKNYSQLYLNGHLSKHWQGRSRDFSKGGGGHTGSNNIVMAFAPRNSVGCLLKKRFTKGGHVHLRTPL